MAQKQSLDRWGMAASGLCLVHCSVLPLAAIALPTLGGHDHEWFHGILLVLVVPLAAYALGSGYKHHRKPWPAILGFLGCALLSFVYFAEMLHFHLHSIETPINILGSISLIGAHFLNTRCACGQGHEMVEPSNL